MPPTHHPSATRRSPLIELKARPRSQNRRGITLLFVVSMIVLFLLMGTTFVVVSNQFFSSARKRVAKSRFNANAQPLIESTFYEVLRGPNLDNRVSPFRGHSLLEDMYGYGFATTIATATADSSGHFIEVTLNGSAVSLIDNSSYTPSPVPGTMAGLVFSIVDGPGKGLTCRVIDHRVSGSGASIVHRLVLRPHWLNNQFSITNAAALVNSRVVVNGRPFSGTGAGHFSLADINSPALSTSALSPDLRGQSQAQIVGGGGAPGYFTLGPTGSVQANSRGPNEPYDTFDFQNMFLAGIRANGTVIEPSFHRQTLVDNSTQADFRAIQAGGTNNDGVVVDNNNDGVAEGIWLDTGAPIQTSPEGALYKPLVSITVLDMDSRINVNAHGNRSHILSSGDMSITRIPTLSSPLNDGQGLGPAEIRLDPVLGPGATSAFLLGGAGGPGRYGFDGLPGQPNVRDVWSGYKLFGYPDAPFSAAQPGTVGRHFGTALDTFGRFGVAYPNITDISDPAFPIGMPMGDIATSALASEMVDSPYEMNFADDAFFGPVDRLSDTLFSARELEAVLRRRDPDSSILPQRMVQLGGGAFNGAANSLVTTSSVEVPTLHENLVSRLFNILNASNSGGQQLGIPDSTSNREQVIRDQLALLLPTEFFRGLPMNVNRPLGDGIDNDADGVIDEIGEVDRLTHPNGSSFRFDSDNDSSTSADPDASLARANFARQLFVTVLLLAERVDRNGDGMITLAGDWYDFNDSGGVPTIEDRIEFRRAVAQWAINVVDFRDPDSNFTPFEVDLNPFNGWDVDGRVTSTESITENGIEMRQVFWGLERPELLITETLATHDHRTQDLIFETTRDGSAPDVAPTDQFLDSHLVPQASVFFELYNPWVVNDANQIRPPELYDTSGSGVDLQRTSIDGSSPVWRLVVTEVDDPATSYDETELDPDQPANNPGGVRQDFVRRIYFAEPTFDAGPQVYFPDSGITASPIGPGRYGLVGSAGIQVGNSYHTYFGRRDEATALDPDKLANETRRLSMNPSAGELELLSARTSIANVTWDVSTRTATVLPIGRNNGGLPRNLGVSDPIDGYFLQFDPVSGFQIDVVPVADGLKFSEDTTTGTPVDYAFDQPIDRLIDETHYDRFLKDTGLKPGYRVVHLQRLANPNLPFDVDSNPYRTIDSSALDLFVFNGVESTDDPQNSPGTQRFGTYERRAEQNEDATEVTAGRHRMLFRNDKNGNENAMAEAVNDFSGLDQHHFSRNLVESLTLLNQSDRDAGAADQRPFAALTWNNRPYISELEIVNVPFYSSFQLTDRFSSGDAARDVYEPDKSVVPETGAVNASGHFSHLLNFYADRVDGETNGPSLHRLLSFLEVPSRYSGAESFVNPATFADNAQGMNYGFAPPFDRISNYRYQGKININTVTNAQVWSALMSDYAGTVPFNQWEASRQGASPVTNFANPYRPEYASNMVPQAAMVVDPVECGLFRQRAGTGQPLFDNQAATDIGTDGDRSAFFKYDMRQRLGNLVTGRSSVFAIWITVGYFEVNPDGSLRLDGNSEGIEIGAATGETRRSRGFFVVDRSIPVAFEPGQNHNVDRAILVKSIIE